MYGEGTEQHTIQTWCYPLPDGDTFVDVYSMSNVLKDNPNNLLVNYGFQGGSIINTVSKKLLSPARRN